jgi:protein involved in polysaccharide export with SLBB domain
MRKFILSLVALCVWASPVRSEIKAGDSLRILIRGVPVGEKAKVEGQFVVGKSGTIVIPLADVAVRAQGLSAEALARAIENVFRTAEIYTHPNIEVLTKGIEAQGLGAEVSVGGHVRKPGPIRYRNGMSLIQAIQAAGDLDPFGSKRRVYVTRGKSNWVVDMRTAEGRAFVVRSGDTVRVDRRKALEKD